MLSLKSAQTAHAFVNWLLVFQNNFVYNAMFKTIPILHLM